MSTKTPSHAPWARLDATFGRERWVATVLSVASAAVFAVYVMVLAEAVRQGEARAHQPLPATVDLRHDRGSAQGAQRGGGGDQAY